MDKFSFSVATYAEGHSLMQSNEPSYGSKYLVMANEKIHGRKGDICYISDWFSEEEQEFFARLIATALNEHMNNIQFRLNKDSYLSSEDGKVFKKIISECYNKFIEKQNNKTQGE